jgi:hypothetical protein
LVVVVELMSLIGKILLFSMIVFVEVFKLVAPFVDAVS